MNAPHRAPKVALTHVRVRRNQPAIPHDPRARTGTHAHARSAAARDVRMRGSHRGGHLQILRDAWEPAMIMKEDKTDSKARR